VVDSRLHTAYATRNFDGGKRRRAVGLRLFGGFSTREKSPSSSCGLPDRAHRLLSLRIGALVNESLLWLPDVTEITQTKTTRSSELRIYFLFRFVEANREM
jgi:hypothetical protein